jgi:outer membrane usher protein
MALFRPFLNFANAQAPAAPPGTPRATGPFCATLPGWKAWAAASAAGPGRAARPPELVLDAQVNGDPGRVSLQAVCLPDARLGVLETDWRSLRLRPTTAVRLADGRSVFALESVAGLTYAVDTLAQTLDVTVPPAAFDASRLSAHDNPRNPPPPPPLGGYLTYDVTTTLQNGQSPGYGVGLEGVAFGRMGLLDVGGALRGGGDGLQLVRGAVYWERPLPGEMADLTIGDAIGGAGEWSRPVRFAGVRFSREFDANPGFITYPTATISGAAALPSTIDVMINNQSKQTLSVPAGPFDITNLPVLTGGGQLQLVVKDSLGRETIITQPYYVSPRLLSPGLADFDFYAGFLRQNFEESNDRYGDPVAAADYRIGLADGLTVEGRGEAETGRYAAGFGALTRVGTWAAVHAAAAYAASDHDLRGGTYVLGVSSTWTAWGVNAAWRYFDPGYRPFAPVPGETRPRQQLSAGGGLQIGSAGSLSLSYIHQSNYDGAASELINAGWSRRFGRKVSLGLSVGGDLANHGWNAGLTLGVPLGGVASASASVTGGSSGPVVATAQAGSGTPSGPGVGWRVQVGDTPGQTFEGDVIYNAPWARLSGGVAYGGGGSAVRLDATGSAGVIGGATFLARPIQSSFALVRTGEVSGVGVMLWNQLAAVTGGNGTALITNLGAYQQNKISIDPAQIPLDVEIGATALSARPWPRSGVIVDFPIRRTRDALVVLRTADGGAPPNGARVSVSPGGAQARVADGGEVWVTDLADQNRLSVQWGDHGCQATLYVPAKTAPGARLGPIACAGR